MTTTNLTNDPVKRRRERAKWQSVRRRALETTGRGTVAVQLECGCEIFIHENCQLDRVYCNKHDDWQDYQPTAHPPEASD